MGCKQSLIYFHLKFPTLKQYFPNNQVLNEMRGWVSKIAPHLRSKNYRSHNNERIRLEMRRIVKSHTKLDLTNDTLIDLVVDFLIHPYVNDDVKMPDLDKFLKLV